MDNSLAIRIIEVLASGRLTEDEIVRRLDTCSFTVAQEIQFRADVLRALTQLKAEHRAWPTGRTWKLTTRGRGE